MNWMHHQDGNPELTEELTGLSIHELSDRCSEILSSKTIPDERLSVLLDNMARFSARSKNWTRGVCQTVGVPYEEAA